MLLDAAEQPAQPASSRYPILAAMSSRIEADVVEFIRFPREHFHHFA